MSDVITPSLNRLAYQFKGSTKLQAFFQVFLEEFQELEDSGQLLIIGRSIDNAIGAQLDGIGEIVGQDRLEEPINIIGAFGFDTDTTARGFGTVSDPDIGGNFVSYNSTKELIGDDIYRTLIRAKIIKNQTAMIVDDTTRLISFMFGGVPVRYFLIENLKPFYTIGKILSPLEELLLGEIPILIGLTGVVYYSAHNSTPFAFAEDPVGLGFGDITDTTIGGNFAKIIT